MKMTVLERYRKRSGRRASMRKMLVVAVIGALLVGTIPSAALAGDPHAVSNRWAGAAIGAGAVVLGGLLLNALQTPAVAPAPAPYSPPPVYAPAPQAIYPAPPPVVVTPPPVVYAPPPVVYAPPPVVYAPPVIVHRAPVVVYRAAPRGHW